MMKRSRPISKRKKFKKSLGPDFLEPSELGLQYLKDSFEPRCDICQMPATSNRNGKTEDLLICKDCDAKAHPSCMNYNHKLAARSRRSPWQCIDCKTCNQCHDSGDAENMLFCDECDKGFHMKCHKPSISKKPSGKWICKLCLNNGGKDDTKDKDCHRVSIDTTASSLVKCDASEQDISVDDKLKASLELNEVIEINANITPNPQNWTTDDVETYIRFIGFPDQSVIFKEQEIDGISLLLLRRIDVLTGLSMKLGPALKIYSHVKRLQTTHSHPNELK